MILIDKAKSGYSSLISIGEFLQSFLLLAIRLFWGWQFYVTGTGKLQNIAKSAAYFQGLGIPFPELNSYVVGYIEMVGGICLMLGLLSRLVSIPMMGVMVVAYLTAHIDAVRKLSVDYHPFIEQPPFLFLLALLIIFCFGPGKISVDYFMKRLIFKDKG